MVGSRIQHENGGASTLNEEKVLNLGFMDWDDRKNVIENRQRFQQAVGAGEFTLVPLKQIHSDLVHRFTAGTDRTLPSEMLRHQHAELTARCANG